MNKTLILALGSEILTDDGIGLRIACDLKKELTIQDEPKLKYRIDFASALTGSPDLLEIIKGYDTLVIIDAIKTKNGNPGNVYHYSLKNYKETFHLENIHDISFPDTLKLGKSIGLKIPENVNILAIEIFDNLTFGNTLSEILTKKYSEILKKVKKLVFVTSAS
ncbi:MAG: hydrogenase maturation protease [Bacteroidetes bacterium]|nr:hydrogenase maturation protease [Bacteroidota bacterium]MBL7103736.1 hydrogenase maturation protease [Bacteroidales bacterium]